MTITTEQSIRIWNNIEDYSGLHLPNTLSPVRLFFFEDRIYSLGLEWEYMPNINHYIPIGIYSRTFSIRRNI